jgi:hypothetical protein
MGYDELRRQSQMPPPSPSQPAGVAALSQDNRRLSQMPPQSPHQAVVSPGPPSSMGYREAKRQSQVPPPSPQASNTNSAGEQARRRSQLPPPSPHHPAASPGPPSSMGYAGGGTNGAAPDNRRLSQMPPPSPHRSAPTPGPPSPMAYGEAKRMSQVPPPSPGHSSAGTYSPSEHIKRLSQLPPPSPYGAAPQQYGESPSRPMRAPPSVPLGGGGGGGGGIAGGDGIVPYPGAMSGAQLQRAAHDSSYEAAAAAAAPLRPPPLPLGVASPSAFPRGSGGGGGGAAGRLVPQSQDLSPTEHIENVRDQARAWAHSPVPGYPGGDALKPERRPSGTSSAAARANMGGAAAAARAARDAYPSLRADNPYASTAGYRGGGGGYPAQ